MTTPEEQSGLTDDLETPETPVKPETEGEFADLSGWGDEIAADLAEEGEDVRTKTSAALEGLTDEDAMQAIDQQAAALEGVLRVDDDFERADTRPWLGKGPIEAQVAPKAEQPPTPAPKRPMGHPILRPDSQDSRMN